MRPFTKIRRDTIDPLAKARTHARMKAIGVKITVVTSAALDVGLFRLRKKKKKTKKKHEQMEDWVVFCE